MNAHVTRLPGHGLRRGTGSEIGPPPRGRHPANLEPMTAAYDEPMARALVLAAQAGAAGDVPVGAVVLDAAGRIVGEGLNLREQTHDPTAHAEVVALRAAAAAHGG